MNVSVIFFPRGPAMSWPLVQSVILPSPYDSRDGLQQILVTLSSGKCKLTLRPYLPERGQGWTFCCRSPENRHCLGCGSRGRRRGFLAAAPFCRAARSTCHC